MLFSLFNLQMLATWNTLYDIPETNQSIDIRASKVTTIRGWQNFLSWGSLYFINRTNLAVYSTYYVLAKRGAILVTNAHSIKELLVRIYGFFRMQPQCLRWVFTFRPNQVNLARWFSYETDSDAYMQVARQITVFSVQGTLYLLQSRYLSYSFLYFMGCDVAFVFTSFSDEDHFLDFKDKGVPTVGFDGGHHSSVYTYGLPGGLNGATVLLYARVMSGLIQDIYRGHWFWSLQKHNFII